ncbi:MAG: PHP domain-containing protein [Christensenellales bacterium]
MLQFFDKIHSKKGFVDLHNHTNDSYGEEMDKMNLSAEELLESVYAYTKKNSCNATFAVTDHNSIDGVQKIDLLIKADPKKYEKVNFISGCEFTCSAGSLGTIKNNSGHVKNIFKNFHMLAYGFNPFDEDLTFLCKLHSTRRHNSITLATNNTAIKISAGAYVLAIKTILKDYGINLPLSAFRDVNLNTNGIDEQKYIKYLISYIEKFNLPEMTKKDIFYQLSNRNMITLGRLDCMEVMEIVENAGGYCVLAHPYLLKLGSWATEDPKRTQETFKAKLKECGIQLGANESLRTLAFQYCAYILKNEAKSQATGKKLNGIVGLEVLHSSASTKDVIKNLVKTANDNNLYITNGSDSHGTLLKAEYLAKFVNINLLTDPNVNPFYVTKNLFADSILNGTIKQNLCCNKSFDEQIEIQYVENGKEKRLLFDELLPHFCESKPTVTHSKKQQKHNKSSNIEQTKIISSGTTNLNTINFLFNKILQNPNMSEKKVVQEYKLLQNFKAPVDLAISTISKNYNQLKDKKFVKNFFKSYSDFKDLRKIFISKYQHLLTESSLDFELNL